MHKLCVYISLRIRYCTFRKNKTHKELDNATLVFENFAISARADSEMSWHDGKEGKIAPANHLSFWSPRKRSSVPPDWSDVCGTRESKTDQLIMNNLLHVILHMEKPPTHKIRAQGPLLDWPFIKSDIWTTVA